MSRTQIFLVILEIVAGVGAVAGGAALVAVPGGGILGLPPSVLEGSPFASYLVPGLLLAFVVGGSLLFAAVAQMRRVRFASGLSFAAGAILVGWIAVQVAMIGYHSLLQPLMFVVGALVLFLALARSPRRPATP